MILGLAMPLVVLLTLSFWLQEYLDFIRTFSLANYFEFFQKPIFGKLLLKSIRISGMVTLATVLLAYPMAYFILRFADSPKEVDINQLARPSTSFVG